LLERSEICPITCNVVISDWNRSVILKIIFHVARILCPQSLLERFVIKGVKNFVVDGSKYCKQKIKIIAKTK
jgi:hypothetical protein